jgi:DNA-binding Lrp family transcriptional regulator
VLKDVYRRLLFEMMVNSRRSDRELGKILRVSQPTVTRARNYLESNGFVSEYTLIPDFAKIGFELVAITFFRMRQNISGGKYAEIREKSKSFIVAHPNIILALGGEGMGCAGIFVSFHRNFADFTKFMRDLKTETTDTEVVGNFLSSLEQANALRHLTFKPLKEYDLKNQEEKSQ